MRSDPCNSWCAYDNKGICRYCGWPKERETMGLRIWDVATGDYRDATQLDIDEMQLIVTAYGRIQGRFTEDRAQLVKDIEAARSKAGKPNDLMIDNDKVTGDV